MSATTPGGTSSPVAFTYLPAPTATALTPSDGPMAGGTTVTVSGAGFVSGATSVTIGSDTLDGAAVAVAADGNSLTFVTPGGPAGPVDVMVTTPGGSSTPPLSFVYRAAPTSSTLTPDEGPLAANTAVVLTGADFVVGGSTVHVVFADATTADIPAGDVDGGRRRYDGHVRDAGRPGRRRGPGHAVDVGRHDRRR